MGSAGGGTEAAGLPLGCPFSCPFDAFLLVPGVARPRSCRVSRLLGASVLVALRGGINSHGYCALVIPFWLVSVSDGEPDGMTGGERIWRSGICFGCGIHVSYSDALKRDYDMQMHTPGLGTVRAYITSFFVHVLHVFGHTSDLPPAIVPSVVLRQQRRQTMPSLWRSRSRSSRRTCCSSTLRAQE